MKNEFSAEELATMLIGMQAEANRFYWRAVVIGCHPFIEFTGLMNEYIKICDRANRDQVQFPFMSAHNGIKFKIEKHEAEYIAEKFECIFAPFGLKVVSDELQ